MLLYRHPRTTICFEKPPSGIGRGRGGKGKAKEAQPPAASIPQAKTITEANELAVQLGIAKHADFDGLDVSVANDMIKQIRETREMFPELPPLDSIGEMHIVDVKIYGKRKVRGSPYGVTCHSKTGETGIGLNIAHYAPSSLESTFSHRREEVATLWHPIGADKLSGTINHEIGHWLDSHVKASSDRTIMNLYGSYYTNRRTAHTLPDGSRIRIYKKMANALSDYAHTNLHEFVAEGWAEYRNNPAPRPLAKAIGDRIVELYKEMYK